MKKLLVIMVVVAIVLGDILKDSVQNDYMYDEEMSKSTAETEMTHANEDNVRYLRALFINKGAKLQKWKQL